MEEVLIDTDVLFALTDSNDVHHQTATQIYSQLREKASIFLTNFVFGELLTLASRKLGHRRTIAFSEIILKNLTILDIDEPLRESAYDIFLTQTSKNISFIDCVNIATLKALDQERVFSFDEHYKKNGFKRLGIEAKV